MKDTDRARLRRIEGNISEEERLRNIKTHQEKRDEIQKIVGNDIVRHDKLVALADKIWRGVPQIQRPTFTSEDWSAAISKACEAALAAAEERLREGSSDDAVARAKVKLLRTGFARQVVKAMADVAEMYREAGQRMKAEAAPKAAGGQAKAKGR